MAILCSGFTNNIIFNKNKTNGGHLRLMCEKIVKLFKRLNQNIIRPKLISKSYIFFIKGLNEAFFTKKITTAAILDFQMKSITLIKTKVNLLTKKIM